MLKAVIFDLNGVFIQGPRLTDHLERDFGVPTDQSIAVLKAMLTKAYLPNGGDVFSHWEPHLQQWNVRLSREQFLDYWFTAEGAIQEMFALAKELKTK